MFFCFVLFALVDVFNDRTPIKATVPIKNSTKTIAKRNPFQFNVIFIRYAPSVSIKLLQYLANNTPQNQAIPPNIIMIMARSSGILSF